MGNLRSVEKAVETLGYSANVSSEIGEATKLIIPGVGAFGAAMERLQPMREAIRSFAVSGRPLMGICLGQQLLFDSSEEQGHFEGLGLIRGTVRYLPSNMGLKVPHIGWSPLSYQNGSGLGTNGVDGEQVYFVHSLHTVCEDASDIAATASYGIEFAAAIQRDNIWGTQFHPEKSSAVGLRILKNFLLC
jgi:glutamine amidotransferase